MTIEGTWQENKRRLVNNGHCDKWKKREIMTRMKSSHILNRHLGQYPHEGFISCTAASQLFPPTSASNVVHIDRALRSYVHENVDPLI
jgi:hypothetical protein